MSGAASPDRGGGNFFNSLPKYLATGASFKSLSFAFRVGASTVGKIVSETVAVIWEELQPIHMAVPKKEDFETISKEYYDFWNFPNCIGAIDGKHIRINCPKNSGSMFYNYKHYFSIVLQGVAAANYKFITIDIGGYGKQSDGGTFQASELYQLLKNEKVDIPDPSYLPQTKIKAPFVLVGDEAYPLLPFLLNLLVEGIYQSNMSVLITVYLVLEKQSNAPSELFPPNGDFLQNALRLISRPQIIL